MLIPRTSKNFLKRARKYAYYQYVLATGIEFEVPNDDFEFEPIENYDELFGRFIDDVNSEDEDAPLMFVDEWGDTNLVLSGGLERLRYLENTGCRLVRPFILNLALVENENEIVFEDSVKYLDGPTIISVSDFIELATKNECISKTVEECISKYSFEDDTFPLDENWKDYVSDEE